MPRLNLICSGMMFFNETGDNLQIVIPKIRGHVRKFTDVQNPTKPDLKDLPKGDYHLHGPTPNKARLANLWDSTGYVVLDGKKVKFHEAKARETCAFVTIPKPTIIRLYRASEPLVNFDILGNCRKAVKSVPSIIHDVVVFSYKNVTPGDLVKLGRRTGHPLATATMKPDTTVNWMLYSDEEQPFDLELDPLAVSDEVLAKALAPVSHPTPLNDFLEVVAFGRNKPGATTLNLSGIGRRDTPCQPAIGMGAINLCLFHELPDKDGTVITPVCGEAGCSGGARATK